VGRAACALRQNGQSWTCRRAPAIEGHYSNAGWLSSGMRFEYRPFAAISDPKNHQQVIEVLLTELGQLGLGLLGAPRERTRLRNRGEVAIGWRWECIRKKATSRLLALSPLFDWFLSGPDSLIDRIDARLAKRD